MQSAIAAVVEHLCLRFPAVPEATVVETVARIEGSFHDVRIHDFIPLLVEREARDVLAHRPDAGHYASSAL